MLLRCPQLWSVAIYGELLRNPQLNPNVRRTLERRIRDWRAPLRVRTRRYSLYQDCEPGHLGIFDFTDGSRFKVTIAGTPLP